MKILSLITHFAHVPQWEEATTRIDSLFPDWSSRGTLSRALAVASVSSDWDRIVFFYDIRTPVLVWLFALLLHRRNISSRMVFTTFLCDTERFRRAGKAFYELARYWYTWTFVRLCRVIVVHSTAEVTEYARVFGVAPSRFRFLHYCVRDDALWGPIQYSLAQREQRVVAVGRHRDYDTFIRAASGFGMAAVIVTGTEDARPLNTSAEAGVEVRVEVPFSEYRDLIRRASVCVVPLGTMPVRSLGQIAVMEAVAARTPLVVARVSQLTDYFEDEVVFYEPGDSEDLKAKLRSVVSAVQPNADRTEAAFNRMMREYTAERYTSRLLDLCVSA